MLRKSVSKVVAMMCAAACVVTAVPVMNVEARTYTAEELYSKNIADAEYTDYVSKYGENPIHGYVEAQKFGSIPASLKDVTVSIENDRTGGINVRWTNCNYHVAVERYDYTTKQWELLGYVNDDKTSVCSIVYMEDLRAGKEYSPSSDYNNYNLYEDDSIEVNKTYKYRITPFYRYPQTRAEAVALGKEAEYDKIVSEYEANGCKVVEENGYSVVFYPSHTTKKVKNTLSAPYMSVKETKYCSKCKTYEDAYYGVDTCTTHNKKYKHQITFDIEWQDVDGYEIYYSNYSDTGFKKWKTVKPKAISHSETAYPARVSGQDGVLSTTFLLHTKLANGKYFYKIRSYVVVNGKKVYSEFSPVVSTYDYILHNSLSIKEANVAEEAAADIQATTEYNQLNRLMNEEAYLWQKYLSGKISKNKFIKNSLAVRDISMDPDAKYGIYKKTVKTLSSKNIREIVRGIRDEIVAKYPKQAVYCVAASVTYKKSKKVFEISIRYNRY